MSNKVPEFDLPDGWSCRVELKSDTEGTFGGKAELLQGRTTRCVLVLAQQPTRETALDRMRARAGAFIAEWETRPREAR